MSTHQSSLLRAPAAVPRGLQQRKCSCGKVAGPTGECAECKKKRKSGPMLQRKGGPAAAPNQSFTEAPPIVHDVLRSPGQPLDAASRAFMEPRFGYNFNRVRVHADSRAAQSAEAVNAQAYTVGSHIVFGAGQQPHAMGGGKNLLAHELAHVLQQSGNGSVPGRIEVMSDSSAEERNADATADAALAGRPIGSTISAAPGIQRRAAPYIKKVTVNLAPPQSASLEWEGTPPAQATGSDHFTVSTGKGYSDPGDPAGTCTRSCCTDAMTQCAPPWNTPEKVGACCTYYGNNFWTGTPENEHNGWKWWTPVQPYYPTRGIALHQHDTVTGQPIGHGCVRMDEPNAKRIFDFSNGRGTNVTIAGRAAPVLCEANRQCNPPAGGSRGAQGEGSNATTQLAESQNPVPGQEGQLT